MFIVRNLIINHTQKRHIYIQTERRGNRLGTRETERECVCERRREAGNKVGIRCKNGCWGATNHFRIIYDYEVKITSPRETILMGGRRIAKIY